MSEYNPGEESEDLVHIEGSDASDCGPFESNPQSRPKSCGSCQELFFRGSMELGHV